MEERAGERGMGNMGNKMGKVENIDNKVGVDVNKDNMDNKMGC